MVTTWQLVRIERVTTLRTPGETWPMGGRGLTGVGNLLRWATLSEYRAVSYVGGRVSR